MQVESPPLMGCEDEKSEIVLRKSLDALDDEFSGFTFEARHSVL
jgi:hypothetical protein